MQFAFSVGQASSRAGSFIRVLLLLELFTDYEPAPLPCPCSPHPMGRGWASGRVREYVRHISLMVLSSCGPAKLSPVLGLYSRYFVA